MECKIVPFTAQIKRDDTSATVAGQMQSIINTHIQSGWDYSHMDSVQTYVDGDAGCFGIGAKPGYVTTFNVLVFKK